MTPSPAEDAIFIELRAFLAQILPDGTPIVQAQVNRVPEPADVDHVLVTPRSRPRLSTNVDTPDDSQFTASIAGTVMTVASIDAGTIDADKLVSGSGVTIGTKVVSGITGSGGTGTYRISPSQTVALQSMAAGGVSILTPTQIVMQIDVYGPSSGDNAQVIMALMRDNYGVQFFADRGGIITPLFADDPKQLSFTNEQQQYENRWMVEANFQINETILVPQQFAATVEVDLIDVDADFPG